MADLEIAMHDEDAIELAAQLKDTIDSIVNVIGGVCERHTESQSEDIVGIEGQEMIAVCALSLRGRVLANDLLARLQMNRINEMIH